MGSLFQHFVFQRKGSSRNEKGKNNIPFAINRPSNDTTDLFLLLLTFTVNPTTQQMTLKKVYLLSFQ
jgi:hypothetical protein